MRSGAFAVDPLLRLAEVVANRLAPYSVLHSEARLHISGKAVVYLR
jgi:hypothetical protein